MVVDSLGVGHMADVREVRPQDEGANTLGHILEQLPNLRIPNLLALGAGKLLGDNTPARGVYGKLNLQHQGADSYMGHQELMGSRPQKPLLVPFENVIDEVKAGLEAAGFTAEIPEPQLPYLLVEGLVVVADNIETDYGQIYNVSASLTEISFEHVLAIGRKVRELVQVNRVIALGGMVSPEQLRASIERRDDGLVGVNSPRSGVYGSGYRVRHLGLGIDPSQQLPALLAEKGCQVSLIGKMQDVIEAEQAQKLPAVETDLVLSLAEEQFQAIECGLVAATVQETDLAGHAQDVERYGRKLELVDVFLGRFMEQMNAGDALFVTGDHGNDPTIGHSQHTREKTPLLAYSTQFRAAGIGERTTLSDIAATIAAYFASRPPANGRSFLGDIT